MQSHDSFLSSEILYFTRAYKMKTAATLMSHALKLAESGRLTVSPNPMVGCVIVNHGQMVGEGFHRQAGGPHAEIIALQQAGLKADGATAYVTLEPCCHYGRTPPCVTALIKAGIREVFISTLDPNPLVAGKGIHALRKAGITVTVGLMEKEAIRLNEIFFHYIQSRRPFVIAKWAMSLDGKTKTHLSDANDISCPASRQHSHQIRQQADAILIGAKTAIDDDPLLTVRYAKKMNDTKQPIRVILSKQGHLPAHLKLFNTPSLAKTLIATTAGVDDHWVSLMQKKEVEVLILPQDKEGKVDLMSLLDELGKREITSLLVEGGMTVHHHFFKENLINKVQVYLAPLIIGSLEKKERVVNMQFEQIDHDFYFTADYGES
jgi:diaminohydroxyphosphoribosylaminopyrimidine deaminase/5-amino-6-(5-phosphoribosylamino)uracil reductase